MKLIVGLGNPGKEYEDTRHNVGFMVIDRLAEMWDTDVSQMKFKSEMGQARFGAEKVILLKPLTYMNLSGEAIRQAMDFYKLDLEDLLVIYDDLDLPAGKIRLRKKGSAGGHNGIKSTISHTGSQEFKRIKVGIDRPQNGQKVVDYVLQRFSKEQLPDIEDAVERSAKACDSWVRESFDQVMNQFNG